MIYLRFKALTKSLNYRCAVRHWHSLAVYILCCHVL